MNRVQSRERMAYIRLDGADSIFINDGTAEKLECIGYCRHFWKSLFFYIWAVLNLGFPFLLIYWRPEWKLWWQFSMCELSNADWLLLKNNLCQYFVTKVKIAIVKHCPAEFLHLSLPLTDEIANSRLNNHAQHAANEECFLRYFLHQHVKFVWNQRILMFEKLRGYDENITCKEFYDNFKGYTLEQQKHRSVIFGENSINVEIKSYFKLLIDEVLNPFYIFQIFSVILWSSDDYYYFAVCIFLVSLMSISVSLYKTRKQSKILHSMVVASTSNTVTVLRPDSVVDVESSSLVPGDVLVIPPTGCTMVCDAVLVAGNCIVNESMLTGESVPVTKTPLIVQDEGEVYSAENHKRNTLFSGTKVIQTRYYGSNQVMAIVVRTGFNTAKGELIRSILYPKPVDFKFYKDSITFIGILSLIAAVGMIYGTVVFIKGKASAVFILKRVLDIITIAVPPALPAAITVGSVHAQNRLRLKNIFCISPPRINVCGKIKLFCFDKTGTLTEDGLDFWGVIPVHNGSFGPVIAHSPNLPQRSPLLAAMAACHSLTMLNGVLTGDPLDIKMFEATKWEIEEPGVETTLYDRLAPSIVRPARSQQCKISSCTQAKILLETEQDQKRFDMLSPTVVKPVTKDTYAENYEFSQEGIALTELQVPYEIGVVRQFPFSSSLQMMSVVARTLGKKCMDIYVKGAPEKILTLCLDHTVPANINALLHEYTIQGFRVIALAWQELDSKLTWHQVQRIKRDKVEKDLCFLGLLVMQNTLKPETTPVLRILKNANIRSVMVTGDNMHTAISVARECTMVPSHHKIIILKAFPPEGDTPARIEWDVTLESVGTVDSISQNGSGSVSVQLANLKPFYHIATDGKSFSISRQYFPEIMSKLAIRGTVFARMAPEQKTQLIELLQQQGYIVGMCGDGANDCGALKAAHVGISLSEAEASVAAPFTCKIQNVECVINLIKEGRCALVTSFSVFKYMALYSIIQFVSVLILYTFHTNLADFQFLYIDLAITTCMAVFMGYTKAYDILVPARPNGRLLGSSVMTSIFMQILLAVLVQIGAFLFLVQQPWYEQVSPDAETKFTACYENTIIFCISSFQYLIVAVAFSKAKPFRKPIYTNVPLLISLFVFTGFSVVLLLYPGQVLGDLFNLILKPGWEGLSFRLILLSFPIGHFILSLLIEFFIGTATFKSILHTVTCKTKPKNAYKILERALCESGDWPSVDQIHYSSNVS